MFLSFRALANIDAISFDEVSVVVSEGFTGFSKFVLDLLILESKSELRAFTDASLTGTFLGTGNFSSTAWDVCLGLGRAGGSGLVVSSIIAELGFLLDGGGGGGPLFVFEGELLVEGAGCFSGAGPPLL